MARGQNPLMLMMALSLPGAANALGLGEIHVDSALNEPLAAEIDIVGATAEELAGLTATIASRETFLKFGADRPAFLSTATFKVAHDLRGRPVLSIRSTDSFTEPLVNMVVDLRWHNGEVIRQYSLLLDPAGFPSAIQQAAALPLIAPVAKARPTLPALPAPVSQAPLAVPSAAAPDAEAATVAADTSTTDATAVKSSRKMTQVKIGSRATLRGVAWRVGARSDTDLKKTMLAIFRANPSAFEGNINRLHLGATLTIPSEETIAAIPTDEAKREVRAQMAAWRAMAKTHSAAAASRLAQAPRAPDAKANDSTTTPVPTATTASPPLTAALPAGTNVIAPTAPAAQSETDAVLTQRIQTLEQGLHDVQGQLQREQDKLLGMQAQVKYAEKVADAAPVTTAAVAPAHPWPVPAILGGLTLLAGALAAIYWKLRRRPAPKASPQAGPQAGPQASPKVDLAPVKAFLERSSDSLPTPVVAAEVVRKDPPRMAQRPIMTEDGLELSAAWNSVRDQQEAKVRAQLTAALTNSSTRSQSILTVTEEELHAAYEDTLDLSSETALLAAEIAAASSETESLPAATVNLRAESMRHAAEAAEASTAETGSNETVVMDMEDTTGVATITLEPVFGDSEPTVEHPHASAGEMAELDPSSLNVDMTKLDYNLVDLDLSSNHHVQMPSMLHEQAVVKERRTNLVDVLKMAIEREPDRSDLRMKLLETYFAAAATNRQGFLEVVQKLARERERLGEGEWDKIAFMGKQIASDTGLFASSEDEDDKLADYAA